MKYLTRPTSDGFCVSLRGDEQEQERQSILAENLFNTPITDSYIGRSITFRDNKQFKNFLFWKNIFAKYPANGKFIFLKAARPAAREVRGILNKEVFSLDDLN